MFFRQENVFLFYFYFRYDNGRVLACQGRVPERFYYVLSGRGKLLKLSHVLKSHVIKDHGLLISV